MMPFICVSFGGELHFLISWTLWRLARERRHLKPPWFLILSADNQIDRCLPRTCSPLLHLYPAQRWAHAVHPALQSDYLDQAISRGRLRHWVVKGSSVSQISQDLDTSNWDFMAYFLRDSKKLRPVPPQAEFPQGWGWKKMFSGFIWFLVALRAFGFCFFSSRSSSFSIKVPFFFCLFVSFGRQSNCGGFGSSDRWRRIPINFPFLSLRRNSFCAHA